MRGKSVVSVTGEGRVDGDSLHPSREANCYRIVTNYSPMRYYAALRSSRTRAAWATMMKSPKSGLHFRFTEEMNVYL